MLQAPGHLSLNSCYLFLQFLNCTILSIQFFFCFLLPAFESNNQLGFCQNQADLPWGGEEHRQGVPLLDPSLHGGVEPGSGLGWEGP